MKMAIVLHPLKLLMAVILMIASKVLLRCHTHTYQLCILGVHATHSVADMCGGHLFLTGTMCAVCMNNRLDIHEPEP